MQWSTYLIDSIEHFNIPIVQTKCTTWGKKDAVCCLALSRKVSDVLGMSSPNWLLNPALIISWLGPLTNNFLRTQEKSIFQINFFCDFFLEPNKVTQTHEISLERPQSWCVKQGTIQHIRTQWGNSIQKIQTKKKCPLEQT